MIKKILVVLAVVALLSIAASSMVSAQGPWWMQEDGKSLPPRANAEYDCPEDCPYNSEGYGRNFVDENKDGINDNAGQMGRWFEDESGFGPGMMRRQAQQQEDFGPRMGGRWSEENGEFQMPCQRGGNFGPGRMMGRMGQWNQGCDGDCGNERPFRNFQNNEGAGQGMGRGWMMR